MKLFSEITRIIDQFFETEYFFRFRKEKNSYQRNLWTLNDTWSGGLSMLGFMEIKCRQMYHNLRKYSYHNGRMIDGYALLDKSISYDEKLPFIKRSIVEFLDSDSNKYFIGNIADKNSESTVGSYYLIKDSDKVRIKYYIEKAIKSKTTKVIANWETLETEEKQDYKEESVKTSDLIEANPDSIIEAVIKFCNNKEIDIAKAFLSFEAFEIKPDEYIKLSDKLKSLVRGTTISLHEIWTFRKLLRKYMDLSDDSDCYKEKWSEVYVIKDDKERSKALEKLYNEYKKDKYNAGMKAMKYFIEHQENWVD